MQYTIYQLIISICPHAYRFPAFNFEILLLHVLQCKDVLTLVAEDASPVSITDALPGGAIAVAVLTPGVGGALVTELPLPAWSTSVTESILKIIRAVKFYKRVSSQKPFRSQRLTKRKPHYFHIQTTTTTRNQLLNKLQKIQIAR